MGSPYMSLSSLAGRKPRISLQFSNQIQRMEILDPRHNKSGHHGRRRKESTEEGRMKIGSGSDPEHFCMIPNRILDFQRFVYQRS
jgi:hypothetical protein